MNEAQPTEGGDEQPGEHTIPDRPSQQAAEGNSEGQGDTSATDIDETDAGSGTGDVAGRGPGSGAKFEPRSFWERRGRGLAALRHRDFRLFWLSQLVSLVGTWMQVMAQGWLVLEIGGSAFDLGAVSALQFLPALLFSLFGGILADQLPKRFLLLCTQAAAMVLAFVLGLLTLTGVVNILDIMILAALLGIVSAVDMPTRQAFVAELAGRRDLPNAVALNSAGFNLARMAGPALGGLLIGWIGTGGVFLLNGVTYLPVLAALFAMKAGSAAAADVMRFGAVLENIREGLGYVRRTPTVLATIILVALVGTFGMNFSVIAPLFAKDILNSGAEGLGILMMSMGIGSLLASLMLAFLEWEPHPNLLVGGAAVFGVIEVVLSQTDEMLPAIFLWGTIGFALIFLTTTANTALQTSTPDHLRGRVMSIFLMVFVGSTPIGSLFAGSLAQFSGVPMPLLAGGAISILAALLAWWQLSGVHR